MTYEQIKRMQAFLLHQGYRIAVDGLLGPLTESAKADWQSGVGHRNPQRWNEHHGKGVLQLPRTFVATHETAGLPGYPARDIMAPGGTIALAPDTGKVGKLSGHPLPTHPDPALAGGPLGWTVYLENTRGRYFLTHFGERYVTLNQHVKRGDELGTVAPFYELTMGITPDHIHEGFHAF